MQLIIDFYFLQKFYTINEKYLDKMPKLKSQIYSILKNMSDIYFDTYKHLIIEQIKKHTDNHNLVKFNDKTYEDLYVLMSKYNTKSNWVNLTKQLSKLEQSYSSINNINDIFDTISHINDITYIAHEPVLSKIKQTHNLIDIINLTQYADMEEIKKKVSKEILSLVGQNT
jgi:hypothetical protein